MADAGAQEQFLRSWWQWRNGLPSDQQWMADAMAWSASRSGDVQAYQADWSRDQIGSYSRRRARNLPKVAEDAAPLVSNEPCVC